MQLKDPLQNNIPILRAQVIVVAYPDLLIRANAHRMDNPSHAFDQSDLFALEMGRTPKMDGILIAARAHSRAIAQESDCHDFRIMPVIDALQAEVPERNVVHTDFHQRTITALPDDQLVSILRKGRRGREGFGQDGRHGDAGMIVTKELLHRPDHNYELTTDGH